MDKKTKRQVIATLVRAGRRDLAFQLVGAAAGNLTRMFKDAEKKLKAADGAFDKLATAANKAPDSDAKAGALDAINEVADHVERAVALLDDIDDYLNDMDGA